MTPVVYVVGLVLIVVGAFCILTGAPMVRLEQGWTEVIAGSVVGSAGFVIVAIGACLSRLNVLIRTFEGLSIADAHPLDAPTERLPAETTPPLAETPVVDGPVMDRPAADTPHPRPPVEPVPVRRDEAPPAVEAAAVDVVTIEPAAEPEPIRQEPEVRPEPAMPAERIGPAVRDIEVAAPERVIRTARTRTSFLPSFIGRHVSALNRQPGSEAPAMPGPTIEPVLTPLREVAPHPGPDRTSIDLSSGWPDMALDGGSGLSAGRQIDHDDDIHQSADEGASDHRDGEILSDRDGFEEDRHEGGIVEHGTSPERVDHGSAQAPDPDPSKPTVVGRYNAGSASYVMYSNGMIEVETETGTHQFESMQELKRFIEQQDAARV